MKTILEHLKELPEPWRTAAISQCDESKENVKVCSLLEAVDKFADYRSTKEAYKAWNGLLQSMRRNTPYPEYPKGLLEPEAKDNSIPAFPIVDNEVMGSHEGMSLRDYFAGQALAGATVSSDDKDDGLWIPEYAYKLADAMLKARAE